MQERVLRWFLRRLMFALNQRNMGLIVGLICVVLTVIFGIVGFGCYYHGVPCLPIDLRLPVADPPPWSTIVYLALQLIVLNSSAPEGSRPIPLTLELARFFGVAAAAVTTFTALMALFANGLEDWLLRQLRGHVVVCGFGNKGAPLVDDLLHWGLPVVVVEQHPREADVIRLHARGVHVVAGDATDRTVLFRAGCERASYIVVASGNDDTEVAVVEQVVQAVMLNPTASPRRPVLYVSIQDPVREARMETLLRLQSAGEPGGREEWQMFNLYDRVAKAILTKHFVFDRHEVNRRTEKNAFAVVPDSRLTLAVVGDTPLADSLIANLLRAWRPRHAQRGEQLHLVVIGPTAQKRVDTLKLEFPALITVCDVRVEPSNVRDLDPDALAGVRTIYICHETDTAAADAVYSLWPHAASQNARVIVSFDQRTGLSDLARQGQVVREPDKADRLVTFSLAESFIGADLVFERVTDKLAVSIHKDYLARRRRDEERAAELRASRQKAGLSVSPSPPYNPYRDPDNARAQEAALLSSLQQAQHILYKLDLVGCTIQSSERGNWARRVKGWSHRLTSWLRRFTSGHHESASRQADAFFKPDERKMLAVLEHDRWNDERLLEGWEVGGSRDDDDKIHPNLVPWDDVPSDIQKFDFEAIEGLPARLADVGFEIVRRPATDAPPGRALRLILAKPCIRREPFSIVAAGSRRPGGG